MPAKYKGPEFQEDEVIPITQYAATGLGAATAIPFAHPIKRDRMINELILALRMRIVVGATPPGASLPEAPWSFFQNVLITGEHKVLGTRVPCNLDGTLIRELWLRHGRGYKPYLKVINVTTAATTFPQSLANLAANTSYDVIAILAYPFYWPNIFHSEMEIYGLNGPDWLVLNGQVTAGDASALFVFAGGQVVSFQNFGGGGNPVFRLYLNRPNLGEVRDAISPAVIQRNSLIFDRVVQGASATDQPIQDLRKGLKVRDYVVKSGALVTASLSAGVRVYASLSDAIVTRPKIKLNGTVIRDSATTDPDVLKDYYGRKADTDVTTQQGYAPLDFAESQTTMTAFPGDSLTDSDLLQLAGDWTGAANQGSEVMQEMFEGIPTVRTSAGVVHALTGAPVAGA